MMDTYQLNLTGLLGLCAALCVAQQRLSSHQHACGVKNSTAAAKKSQARNPQASRWPFLTVFALVMGSDWLQGPFLYSLYRSEHNLPPALISALFTTGFVSGAVSAYVTGTLADAYGRKRACLFFCAAYSVSCILTITTPASLPLLFLGRALGGVSTTLLFSVFESWMVTDFHARTAGGDLSSTFGLMSTMNSVVAIGSGVFSEWIVGVVGTRRAPFAVAVGLLVAAAGIIATQWKENYGAAAGEAGKSGAHGQEEATQARKKLRHMLQDPRIVCLGLASTIFEGSMYLFVFFWGPALTSARRYEIARGEAPGGLPFGIIFASFMASVLAASLLFNLAMERKLLKHTYLLIVILGAADVVFYLLVQPRGETVTFWLFCLFEACVGMYWPCMGYLKVKLIEDGSRAQMYGVLRIPLNIFVVVALYFSSDEDAEGGVFSVCSRLLLVAVGGLYAMVMNEEMLP